MSKSKHQAIRNATLSEAARRLQDFAVERFRQYGIQDARGAALWDAACYLVEEMGDGNWLHAEPTP